MGEVKFTRLGGEIRTNGLLHPKYGRIQLLLLGLAEFDILVLPIRCKGFAVGEEENHRLYLRWNHTEKLLYKNQSSKKGRASEMALALPRLAHRCLETVLEKELHRPFQPTDIIA